MRTVWIIAALIWKSSLRRKITGAITSASVSVNRRRLVPLRDTYCVFFEGRCEDVGCRSCPQMHPYTNRRNMKLYYDMDGVLADFDSAAERVLGMDPRKFEFTYGSKEFWKRLDAEVDFFFNFRPMPGALTLWAATEYLKPGIITALPRIGDHLVEGQKREWIEEWLGEDVEVITCLTKEKPNFCMPGDILIDDRAINKQAWEDKGGAFILHHDALTTWAELKDMKVI